jgi:hypothetical protein
VIDNPFPGKPVGDGLYEISLKEIGDWTLFSPGVPHPDDPFEILPSERVKKATSFALMDVILFFDWASTRPQDENGQNQWAFVVNDDEALYYREKVHSLPLSDVHKLDSPTVVHRFPKEVADLIAPVLVKYRHNPMMFQVVVNHLQCNNLLPVIEGAFFPEDVTYGNDEDYEEAWQRLIGSLQPRDAIFTFDRRSFLSRAIAKFTHGPFSHCAVYAGDGIIHEIVTSGTRMVDIEVYKGRGYRVAAYRHYGRAPNTIEEMLDGMRRTDGRPGYSYFGALLAGIKAFRGHHADAMAPNSLILAGPFVFVGQA